MIALSKERSSFTMKRNHTPITMLLTIIMHKKNQEVHKNQLLSMFNKKRKRSITIIIMKKNIIIMRSIIITNMFKSSLKMRKQRKLQPRKHHLIRRRQCKK
jgi:hypothetical protein